MLRLEDVTLTVGSNELLRGATAHIRPGHRVGLVGPNGSGKTSLLRLMVGELDPEDGRIHRRGGARIGYLPQKAVSGSTLTVWEEASSRMDDIKQLEARLKAAEEAVAAGDESALTRLEEVTEAMRLAGGFSVDERIGEVLHGLGFGPDAWHQTCDTFSGGWQMRIALARLLLSGPDILLLDEPTNHLDLTARSWLARYLESVTGTVVVVSHDRHLLDRATTHTIEVRHKQLHTFSGNLSAWVKERANRDASYTAAFEQQQEEIAKLERFVERFKAKATKAAQARSRQKKLDRMDRLDAPQVEQTVRLRLADAPGSAKEVLTLREAAVGWVAGEDVLRGLNFTLERGMRVVLLGPNGCGKSTFMKALSGELVLSSGRRKVGKDVRIGMFGQDLAQALPQDLSALEHAQSIAPTVPPQRHRAALGSLGLRGGAALRPIGDLSGGEKARVVLASFAVRPFNVLLLDEPTNHLDAVTVDVLIDALAEFEGAMLIVTHDRYLVERLATHVASVREGTIEMHEGIVPGDLEPIPTAQASPATEVTTSSGKLDHEARKNRRRERTKAQRRFERLTRDLEGLEQTMASLEQQIEDAGGDYIRAGELERERMALETRSEEIFEELGALEESLSGELA